MGAAALVIACGADPALAGGATDAAATGGAAGQRSAATLAACLARLREQALARGLRAETFDRHTRALLPDPGVLGLLQTQPEFRTPIWDYLAPLVDAERIRDGRAALDAWRTSLDAIERRFGVDRAVVVAVWGIESDYGRRFGQRPVLRSLATLACFGRRQSFFGGELLAALQILEQGHVDPARFVGSWAGAFGQTQFMPSTFLRTAVDLDGDGRRDIVDSVPDALASSASFLERAGWRSGEPWGFEVRLPPDFDPASAGRRNKRPLAAWIRGGIVHVDARPIDPEALGLSGASRAAALVPALADRSAKAAGNGGIGPAFLVFRNFDAIVRYNASESYALAIAHLADRLRGAGPFAVAWPTEDPGLDRAQRRELQRRLRARGHDIGPVDGLIGARTRAAIRIEQSRLGLEPTGRAGVTMLEALPAAR
ncbi:MAG: lytic murein transglycosylase [Burkholderiales bacterium]|nr:MAG: lytic murein transglycosylase [Burkholderiales bacterium]